LKRYVAFSPEDERALLDLHAVTRDRFATIADVFYARILEHTEARRVLEGARARWATSR
jgi:hypothetical protein